MKTFMPQRSVDERNLDTDAVNDNLLAGADGVRANMARRYTWSPPLFYKLDGLTNASGAQLTRFSVKRPGTDNVAEIAFTELVIVGDGSDDVWTLSCPDTSFQDLELTTVGNAEVQVVSAVPVPLDSFVDNITFNLGCSTASTITRGYLIVHMRSDRGSQGTDLVPYIPSLVDAATDDLGQHIEDQLSALGDAVVADGSCERDLRVRVLTVRTLNSGSSKEFREAGGVIKVFHVTLYVVAAIGTSGRIQIVVNGTTYTLTVAGIGANTTASGDLTIDDDAVDSPMDPNEDVVMTLSNLGAGTISLMYAVVWWS